MKKCKTKTLNGWMLVPLGILIASSGFSQVQQVKTTTQLQLAKPINISTFNKSLSPKYLLATKQFLKSAPRTNLSTNSTATAKSTVQLLKGGVEGRAPSQTTNSTPARDGDYTCVTRSVNEKADFFYQPLFQMEEVFYPGAFFNASALINNQIGYYSLPSSYQRQPYRLSANLFTMTGPPQNPTETIGDGPGEDYSLASFRAAKSLIMNRNANANPPVDACIEYIQANTKEEIAIQLGYSAAANIPAELVALLTGVPVGVNASVDASVAASQSSEKSRLILKVNYGFYSINASPTGDNALNFFTPDRGNDIPANVVFVSSVLYGTTGYVYFESNKSAAELQSTIEETIGAAGPLDQGSLSVGISAETRAKFSATVSKMVACGKGLGLAANSSVAVTSLDNLLALIGTLKNWGPNNQGSPIAYTMNFLDKDGFQALVSYTTQFPNKVCTQTPLTDLKFDVDLELERIDVANINSGFGSKEELYGKLEFTYLKAGSKEINPNIVYWTKSENDAPTNSFSSGTRHVDERHNIIKDLTFDQLKNLSLYLAGELHDDEGIFASRNYQCQECSEFSGDYGKRKLFFIEMSPTQNAINTLSNNGNYQALKFGGDQFIEMNYYESGKKSDGWVKVLWKVWVKPH